MTRLGNINLFVRNIEQARAFYIKALGLTENVERSHAPHFVLLEAGGCTLTLQDRAAPGAELGTANSIELGFAVDDPEAVRNSLKDWGVMVSELEQMGWGGGFDAVDPDGHRLTLYRMNDNHE